MKIVWDKGAKVISKLINESMTKLFEEQPGCTVSVKEVCHKINAFVYRSEIKVSTRKQRKPLHFHYLV